MIHCDTLSFSVKSRYDTVAKNWVREGFNIIDCYMVAPLQYSTNLGT